MKLDPRVQRFYNEAVEARKELKRLAIEIAVQRFDRGAYPLHSVVLPEMKWAMAVGRTDVAYRIIELVDQYNSAIASREMMEARVNAEAHSESVLKREAGDPPAYFDDDDDSPPVRLTPEDAKRLFPSEK